jgi:trimeric autotransporter adhesin
MKLRLKQLPLALCSAGLLMVTGCGGGGDGAPVVLPPATTNLSTTVVDGAIKDALVCLDKNGNGQCEADEVQGRTDVAGNVTLAVPNADVGRFALVAVVGLDAVDADNGPVTVAYTLSAPADQPNVVSPLTTLVQQTIASTGVSTAEAAKSVQDATGITTSLFADFTKVPAPTDGSVSAATVARMVVVTTQQQQAAVASAVGATAIDDSVITQADLDKAIQKKLLEMLPALVAALSDPAVLAAASPLAKEVALLAAATTLVTDSGLTPAAATTVVAINNQATTTVPVPAPEAFIQLAGLSFTDASNYVVRLFTGSLAQATPDSSNNARYVERRLRSNAGNLAKWGSGSDPWRNADLNWNGSAWAACPINFENTSSVRDALGNSDYSYCNKHQTGKSSRATFDISGKTMAEVYAQIRAAGYTNLDIADTAALGSAAFPAGSALFYQTTTPLTEALAYSPAGADSPAGTSNLATQYSAPLAAGGDASTQASGTGCNVFAVDDNGMPTTTRERDTNGTNSTTLEGLIAAKPGTPCVYSPTSSFTYAGTTYTHADPNAGWGTTTVSLGKVGTAPVGSGTVPGFYTANSILRAAFTGANAVAYYACKERFDNGSIRACTQVGTGTYTIASFGDGRALTFQNLPVQTAPLNYNRVFIERGGRVYFGFQGKPLVAKSARLNTTAATALLTQLGVPAEDPSVPLALTVASYQGTWDLRDVLTLPGPKNGTTLFINANGMVACQDRESSNFDACTVTITNPATGAFSYVDGESVATGSFNFLAGTTSGVYTDPGSEPAHGSFVGGRR